MKKQGIRHYSDCEIRHIRTIMGSRWKPLIIYTLRDRNLPYGKLRAIIGEISGKSLTSSLRDLEEEGIISRQASIDSQANSEYKLEPIGYALVPLILSMVNWEVEHYHTEKNNLLEADEK